MHNAFKIHILFYTGFLTKRLLALLIAFYSMILWYKSMVALL